MAVSKLPESVRSFLRTGIVVITPAQTVVELVLNSIDAGATSILVGVDLQNFRLEVSDNGCGMVMEDLEHVGTRYMTSKCHSLQDLQTHLIYFGFRGEALASLQESTGFLTIESRATGSDITYCKTFIRGKPYKVAVSEAKRQSPGTTVTALEFMYNLPVRRKRIKEAIDLEEIKYQMECIAVIHPQISIGLRNDVNSKTIMQSHKCSSVAQAFSFLFGEKIACHLAPVSHELSGYKLTGHIAKLSHTQRHFQFIYVNKRLVLKTKLHKLVNALLTKSYILKPNGPWKNSPISKNLTSAFWLTFPPREKKSKFAVFILNIECAPANYDVCFEPKKTLIEFVNWDIVLKLVEEGVRMFLSKETIGLVDDSPPASRSRNQSQLSVIWEMEELEKECALASVNVQNFLGNNNDPATCVDDERKKSVAVQGIHGLPARRRKSVSDHLIPECSVAGKQVEESNPQKTFYSQNVTSPEHSECYTEDPFPSIHNLSDTETTRKSEINVIDLSCSVEVCDSFLPPPTKMLRKSFKNKILSSGSTDSEDPIFETRQQRENSRMHASCQKRKYVDAHKNLNMTKGKLKNFSFNSRKTNFVDMKSKSKYSVGPQSLATPNDMKKKRVVSALDTFSFSTPKDRLSVPQQNEECSMEAVASTQTNFSGNYQSGAEFSITSPVSRKVSRSIKQTVPMLSKSVQTQDGLHKYERNSCVVHTRDIGIDATCNMVTCVANNSFCEPKIISDVAKEHPKMYSQTPKILINEVLGVSHKSDCISVLEDCITKDKTISVQPAHLPKPCLKKDTMQVHTPSEELIGPRKSVSFHSNPKCMYFQGKPQFPSSANKKMYMRSSDFLNSFKAVQKKSVSFLDYYKKKPKELCKNQSDFLFKDNISYNGTESKDNNSYNGIESSSKLHTQSQHDILGFDASRCVAGDTVLQLDRNVVSKASDMQEKEKLTEIKTPNEFSSCESCQISRSVKQTSETPICVVAVPNISTDDSCASSMQHLNLSTSDSIILKQAGSNSPTHSPEKCVASEEVVHVTPLNVPSCSISEKIQVDAISITSSDAPSCGEVLPSVCSSIMITCTLDKTTTSFVNQLTAPPNSMTSCEIDIGCPESCSRSSTGDSIPCAQVCSSQAQTFGTTICICDSNFIESDSSKASSSGDYEQLSESSNSKVCTSNFFSHCRKTASTQCSCNKNEGKSNKCNTATGLTCCKLGDPCCEKILEKMTKHVEPQNPALMLSHLKMSSKPSDIEKCSDELENQTSESHHSKVGVFQDLDCDNIVNEECNSSYEITRGMFDRSRECESLMRCTACVDKSSGLTGSGSVASSVNDPKNLSNKKSSVRTEISKGISENFGDKCNKVPNNDCGVSNVSKTADSNSTESSVTSQLLIEAMDDAIQNMNVRNVDPGKIQDNCDKCHTNEQSVGTLSGRHLDVQLNISVEKFSGFREWMEAVDSSGRKFYLHTRSGITSYEAPVLTQEQSTFKITERYEFLPKGVSPILQMPTGKSSETPCLAPESREMLTEAVSKGGQLQDELATVKWGASAREKPGSSCTELIDQLMCSAERRMKFCEQNVPNTTITEKCAVKVYSVMYPYSLTKEALAAARVLRQIDKNLILAVTTMDKTKPPHLLVMFDQHAVHERIRVEKLFKDYHMEGSITHFKFTDADPNITMNLSAQEVRIMSSFEDEFHQIGLFYNVLNDTKIQVTKIPTCLYEREKREVKRGASVLQKFLESLIREHVDFLIESRAIVTQVPPTLLEIINSEACKGALKFGHELSMEECQMLVKHLAFCNMPFQCAHGRPSVAPIADLDLISQQERFEKPRLWDLKNITAI